MEEKIFKQFIPVLFLILPLMAQAAPTYTANDVRIAVEKASGSKCKINPDEKEYLELYCVNYSGYSAFQLTIDEDIISGSGVNLEKEGVEVNCHIDGKIKADNKIKISIRCRV